MSYKKNLILHFYELSSLDIPIEQRKSLDISVKYFETLQQALNNFNRSYKRNYIESVNQNSKYITELFNQYGQKIPLTYHIQKTGLCLYY